MSIRFCLAIPILKAHIEFILGQYALYANGETPKPDELGDLFSKDWTREAVGVLVQKGAGHLTQVRAVDFSSIGELMEPHRVICSSTSNATGNWKFWKGPPSLNSE